MSSDATYTSFLDKYSKAPTQSSTNIVSAPDQSRYFTVIQSNLLKIPSKSDHLSALSTEEHQVFYSSDTDLPFIPVLIDFKGGQLPDAKEFAETLGIEEVELVEGLSVQEWDPKEQYKEVVERVRKDTKGDVRVYKVLGEGTRVGYFVLGLKEEGMEGVRVGAVES